MSEDVAALGTLTDDLLAKAAATTSGRATQAFHAAPGGVMTNVVLALMAGKGLSEHGNPGEAFLQVVRGRLRLSAGDQEWELAAGEFVAIPQQKHAVLALEDAVAVLTLARLEKA